MEQTLEKAVQRWRDASLLDDDQVAAIRAHEATRTAVPDAPPPEPTDVPAPAPAVAGPDAEQGGGSGFLAEGLAYVGAALAFGAALFVLGDVWDDLGAVARVLLGVAGTGVLGAGSFALRTQPPGPLHRLSTLLGALAALGLSGTMAVFLSEFTDIDDGWFGVLTGGVGFVAAAALQRVRPSWPVTLALGSTLMIAVIGAEDVAGLLGNEVAIGITMVGLGLAWAALGWSGHLRPRSSFEITGLLVGGVGLQVLAFDAFPLTARVVGVLLWVGVLAVGLTEERTPPAVLGGIGLTAFSPQLVVEVFGESVGGPLALFVGGLVLVGVAVTILRQRSTT